MDVAGIPWTDAPRALTPDELDAIHRAPTRLAAVKLYRAMTNATLAAATTFVDATRLTTCPVCRYAHLASTPCPNPACSANPSCSGEMQRIWDARRARNEAEEAERQRIRDIQRRMGTWRPAPSAKERPRKK